MVLVGAAYVCQQHRAVIYLCWPHGSWSEGLAGVLISTWWAGRLLPALPREERELCQGKPCGVGLSISRLYQALLWPYPDFSLTSSSCRKMRSSEKYLRLLCPEKILERQWVEIQMFPGRNPLIFCSQLVSIFPS